MLPEWENIERVLIICVGQQNLTLIINVLKKLRQLLPSAFITLMVCPSNKKLALQINWIDEILVYKDAKCNANSEYELTLISKLCQYQFEASVIFTNNDESPYTWAYICYLAGIPIRIGQSQEFGGNVLSHCVKPTQDTEISFASSSYWNQLV